MGDETATGNEQHSPQSDVLGCDVPPRLNEFLPKLVKREAETFAPQKQTCSAVPRAPFHLKISSKAPAARRCISLAWLAVTAVVFAGC